MDEEKSINSEEEEVSDNESGEYSEMPEAVLLDLRRIREKIDNMNEKELVDKLKCFHLDALGSDNTLRQRLKDGYKTIILSCKDISMSPQVLPYYVVMDFEATCEELNSPYYRHEIIEFPAVLVDSKKLEIVDTFQMYCKPEINPEISKFCTELTGITQEQVDSAESFDNVLQHFHSWLAKHKLGKKNKYAIVTDGPWDMTRFLYGQCHFSNVRYPKWATKWVNLKKSFSKFYQCERLCLRNMLEALGLDFVGRHHCGLDDAKNIARILLIMIYDGANVQINERIRISKELDEKFHKYCIKDVNNKEGDDKKVKNIRIEAHCTGVYYVDKMPKYKNARRDRLISEVKIAKKIFLNSNTSGKLTCQSELPKKKGAKFI